MNFLLHKVFLTNEALAQVPRGIGETRPGNGIRLDDPLGVSTIGEVIERIIGYLVIVGAPIMVIMVLIAGFQIMSAGGNSEQINKGKNTILYAVIGYGIILLAQGLVFIIEQLLG